MLTRRELLTGNADPAETETEFPDSDDGATAIEYGLIAGLIGIVVVAAWRRGVIRKKRSQSRPSNDAASQSQ